MISARLKKHFPPSRDTGEFTLDADIQASGRVNVLFGPGGAGKTLVLDAIAGFLRPDAGRLMIGDDLLFDAPTQVCLPPHVRRCGYIPSAGALFPHLTVRENLLFAAGFRPKLERHRKVSGMLERFTLGDLSGRYPRDLSGGQRLRCSIARALVAEPRALLLDEPAQGLDATQRAELHEALRQVRTAFPVPVLLVTNDLEEAFALADRTFLLAEGRVLQHGAPAEILDRPASLAAARLLGIFNLLPAEVLALDPGRNTCLLRARDAEIQGPYLPARFKGDRVWVCTRPEEVRARPRNGRPGSNELAVELERVTPRPGGMRLHFAGDLVADISRSDYDRGRHNKDWILEFPSAELRVL